MPKAQKQATMLPETITPDNARAFLDKNKDNRNMREATAQFYAQQIKKKKDGWALNGKTIVIGKDGRVLDGQHRLRAVILANKSIQSFVVRDIDPDTFGTIDVGLRRSPADILTIHSKGRVRWPTAVAAALKIVNQFEEDGTYNTSKEREKSLTHGDLIRLYDENDDIQDNLEVISQYKNILNVIPYSLATSLYTVMKRIDPAACEKFWLRFDSGADMKVGHPVLALKNRFASYMAHNGGKKVHRRLAIAMVIKAWNARNQRKPMEKMTVDEAQVISIK